MKKIVTTTAAMMTLLCASAAETPQWARGVPPALSPDNPYIPALRNFANQDFAAMNKNEKHRLIFLTWSLFDPASKYFKNAELREKLFNAFDAVTVEREKSPSGFWTILEDSEVFNLWRVYGELTPEQLKTWKERLRPSYEKSLKDITDQTQWMSKAANTLFQTAMALEFGAIIYEELDPRDPDPARWRAQARKNIERALEIQLPGGAFSYINTSGPDPIYFNFDTAHLGRYYQLTADPKAAEALKKMANWASAAMISGQLTPFSSTWWKHVVGTGGPYTGFEHVAALTDNPLALHLMEQRRSYIQPYIWSFGNMYAYKKRPLPPAPSRDRCTMDRNANGPALRIGNYDVEMPATGWGDSTFGMAVSDLKGATSYFNAIYVAIPGKIPREGHMSYIMLSPGDVAKHAGVVGKNWIAGAGSFYAHRGIFGQMPPPKTPFLRTELWYADENGAAGSVELKFEEKAKAPSVELWVRTRPAEDKLTLAPQKIGFPDFTVNVSNAELDAPFFDKGGVYFQFRGADKREYKAGETFGAQISVTRPERPVLTASASERSANGNVSIVIRRDGAFRARLVYNPSERENDGIAAYGMRVEEKE